MSLPSTHPLMKSYTGEGCWGAVPKQPNHCYAYKAVGLPGTPKDEH